MSEWKKVKIGDFLNRKRIPIQLEADKEYKLITIKLYHKGVFLRCNKIGSEIHSNMYKVSKGDFILSGIDARNGAFGIVPDSLDGAIVTNDFWYFDIDESIIKKEFFLWLTSTPVFLDACQKSSMGETQRIRLQKEAFFNYQINCPSIEYQDDFLARIKPIIEKIKTIQSETEKQIEYAKLLRQNILQEAIEGKLTANWRKQNPVQKGNPDYDAEALFEKIQKGEVRSKLRADALVANTPSLQPASQFSATPSAGSNAARNARSKSLAPITDEEKPFDIPVGWKWVRLDFLSTNILYGVSESAKEAGKYKLLRITDIQNNSVNWDTVPYTDFNETKVNQYLLHKGDLLFARTGGTVGKSYLVEDCPSNTIYASYLIRVRLTKSINSYFIKSFFESPFYWRQITDSLVGTGQPNCNGQKLANLVLPLPPLKEQEEIVNKVETLRTKVTTLENQIQDRKSLSDKLIFGIIKEVFEEKEA